MEKPIFLKVWLIILFIGNGYSILIYSFGYHRILSSYPDMPVFLPSLYALITFSQLAALFLLWRLKLLGFYILSVTVILAVIVNIAVRGLGGLTDALVGGVGIGVTYFALKPIWKHLT